MHWLPQLVQNFVKDQFTKLCWFYSREDIREEAKIIFKLLFLTRKHILTITKEYYQTRKMSQFWFKEHWLAENAPKWAKDQFTKLLMLDRRYIAKKANIILTLVFPTWRQAFPKKQKGTNKRRKLSKRLKSDSRCTGWDSMFQTMININLPNFVGLLQGTLVKEQKSFQS